MKKPGYDCDRSQDGARLTGEDIINMVQFSHHDLEWHKNGEFPWTNPMS